MKFTQFFIGCFEKKFFLQALTSFLTWEIILFRKLIDFKFRFYDRSVAISLHNLIYLWNFNGTFCDEWMPSFGVIFSALLFQVINHFTTYSYHHFQGCLLTILTLHDAGLTPLLHVSCKFFRAFWYKFRLILI